MAQRPNSGTLEQVLRCLEALAVSPAFTTEMQAVTAGMGSGAFRPGNFTAADGSTFTVNLDDEQFGPPANWVKTKFAKVAITDSIVPAPPYPRIHLVGMPGRLQTASGGAFVVDQQEQVAGWIFTVDCVVMASNDRAEIAERHAYALMDGWERLLRRNPYLGGLVQLLEAEAPPAPGGAVNQGKSGNVAGIMLRLYAYVLRSNL